MHLFEYHHFVLLHRSFHLLSLPSQHISVLCSFLLSAQLLPSSHHSSCSHWPMIHHLHSPC